MAFSVNLPVFAGGMKPEYKPLYEATSLLLKESKEALASFRLTVITSASGTFKNIDCALKINTLADHTRKANEMIQSLSKKVDDFKMVLFEAEFHGNDFLRYERSRYVWKNREEIDLKKVELEAKNSVQKVYDLSLSILKTLNPDYEEEGDSTKSCCIS